MKFGNSSRSSKMFQLHNFYWLCPTCEYYEINLNFLPEREETEEIARFLSVTDSDVAKKDLLRLANSKEVLDRRTQRSSRN